MKNRWTQSGASEAVDLWGEAWGQEVALRLYAARLIGSEPDLVLHGGGNVSVKGSFRTVLGQTAAALHVKCSGHDLATLTPEGIPALDLDRLRRLRTLDTLDDAAMVNELRVSRFDASAPTASIETLLHAFLPYRYVDHSHADAVLAIANHPAGPARVRDALGDRVAIIPYVRPGFLLAQAVADAQERAPEVIGVVLLHHGLITFGEDAQESYDRHIELVAACEEYIDKQSVKFSLTPRFRSAIEPADLVARVAPLLRGLVAGRTGDEDQPYARSILEWRASEATLSVIHSREGSRLSASGPLTGDHLIHTRAHPLFVAEPTWSDESALRKQLADAIDAYKRKYLEYVTAHGGSTDTVNPCPSVMWLPGAGLLCWGTSKRHARVVADIAEHTLRVKARAEAIGGIVSVSDDHLFDMEFRAEQQAKLAGDASRPLEHQVVIISGGAGAIGSAVADECAAAGAHVAVADLDEARIASVVRRVEERHGPGTALGVVMDVTDEHSVRDGFEKTVRNYGGVDLVVPNAGVAHVASIETMAVADFRRVMEINATGYLLFMREGIRILKAQGLGGHIVISASKNVFGPGKDFGAYSASKAAGHQLGKVAAIELAPDGIRVNMINADAVFGDEQTPSGLWATVGPERAKSRNLAHADLPEYYRQRNLLKSRVRGHHVGRAVVFFAGSATPTTGATLPVDGGVIAAFPR